MRTANRIKAKSNNAAPSRMPVDREICEHMGLSKLTIALEISMRIVAMKNIADLATFFFSIDPSFLRSQFIGQIIK
jgi:hypothetical protein